MNDTPISLNKNGPVPEESSVCPIDLEAAKSRVMGDMEFLKELLAEFIESSPPFLEKLTGAVQQCDPDFLSKTAHQIKGAAANLSLNQIAQKAARLLEMGREKRMEHAGEALSELDKAIENFKEYFFSHF